eukprot:7980365-Pyramimonas_sp.AAC.1
MVQDIQDAHVGFQCQSVTAKSSLEFPGQHGDFCMPNNARRSTRARWLVTMVPRARGAPRAFYDARIAENHVTFEIQSATVKCSLKLQGQRGDF